METLPVIVDDSDPAVKYSSGWRKAGGSLEHENTTSGTNQSRTTATFTFVGVRIEVYGTIGPRTTGLASPQSNYTVDGVSPTTYTANQDQSVYYRVMFYQSPVLPLGSHTLIVTNLLNGGTLFLDCFYVYKPSIDPSSSNVVTVTSTLSASTPTSSQTSSSTASSSTISPSTTPSDAPSPSSPNTAAIVGSVFGSIFLIVVAVAFIFWHRGRKRRKMDLDDLTFPTSTYKDPPPASDHTRIADDTLRYQEPMTEYGHNQYPNNTHGNAQPDHTRIDETLRYQEPMTEYGHNQYPNNTHGNAQPGFGATQEPVTSSHTTAHSVSVNNGPGHSFVVEAPSAIAYRSPPQGPYDPYGSYGPSY